jgi:hypothetical protein
MINKIGKKLIIVLALFSINVLADTESEFASANYSDKTINMISKMLQQEHYQLLNLEEFKQKIDDYFGSDTGLSKNKNICQTYTGEDNYYGITNNGKFIYSCLLTNSFANGILDNSNNKYVQQLVAYNKLLFNDDDSAKKYILNHKYDYLPEIVINFNYENDALLYETAVVNPYISDEYKWHFLFYNNELKGYRKRFLNDMLLDKAYFRGLLISLFVNWNVEHKDIGIQGKKVRIPQSTKDKVLIHLIKYRSQLQSNGETLERSQHLAYQYLTDFFNKDNQLKERLEKNEYYNMGITVLEDKKKVISYSHDELLENHYYTKSSEKVVNLLNKPDIKSSIIMTLPNKTDVIKLYSKFIDREKKQEWLYVGLANDRTTTGYIHLSQLEFKDKHF